MSLCDPKVVAHAYSERLIPLVAEFITPGRLGIDWALGQIMPDSSMVWWRPPWKLGAKCAGNYAPSSSAIVMSCRVLERSPKLELQFLAHTKALLNTNDLRMTS